MNTILKTQSRQLVVFDFDGVIVDTFDFCFKINNSVDPQLTEDMYRGYFDGNINNAPGVKAQQAAKLDFFALYAPELFKKTSIEGMPEVIQELASRYSLAIISSTNTGPIEAWLTDQNLRKYFTEILGNDVSKSKVEKFEILFAKENVSSSDCVYITDTLGDIKEGKKVGVESIAVTGGYHDVEKLLSGMPYSVAKNSKSIVDEVDLYFGKNKKVENVDSAYSKEGEIQHKHHLTKKEEQNIRTYFFWSICIKGAISLAEIVVGLLVLIVPVASVGNFFLQIAEKELVEEPGDFIATHFISIVGPATDQLVAAGGVFIALYLLSRGLVKIFLIIGLLKNQLWAYPTSLVILGMFVSYQLYQIAADHSPFIVALTIFDLVVMYFIWKEYKVVKLYETVV